MEIKIEIEIKMEIEMEIEVDGAVQIARTVSYKQIFHSCRHFLYN